MEPDTRIDRSVLGFGLALAAAGFVLTLVKLDLIHLEGLGRLWPLVVVGVGIAHMVSATEQKKRRAGLWIAMVGVWLLVNSFQLFGLFWNNSWPVLMILIALLRIAWPGDNEDRAGGLVVLSVGIWCLLIVTHTFGLEWRTAWPLLLVLVGLSMVVRALLQALPAFLGGRS
ncbi:MAG TPA: hypothetical protein VGS57_09855 [Thermoanaerobaculia bacterium]|jgi:hypothetical protein|nr:hypothetical protein [Thermoanaerobaculia bacterium]